MTWSSDPVRPTAIILAAGLGSRLGGMAKALYPLDGVALIDRSAATLRSVGIDDIMVVTGHDAQSLVAHCKAAWPRPPRFVHNEHFASLNNFYTVALACRLGLPNPLLVINSDIVFTADVVETVLESRGDVVLAVDTSRVDEEAMGVGVRDGEIVAVSKQLAAEDCTGEFVGMSMIRQPAAAVYDRHAREAVSAGETNLYYEDIFHRMARRSPLALAAVDAGAWAEIDAADDVPHALEVARRQVAVIDALR